jgi:hypothetical protein
MDGTSMTPSGSPSTSTNCDNQLLTDDDKLSFADIDVAQRGKSAPDSLSDNKESPRLITEFKNPTIKESVREIARSERSATSEYAVQGCTRGKDGKKFKTLASRVQRQMIVTNLIASASTPNEKRYHPDQKFENTYKMEPDIRFPVVECQQIISQVLSDHLTDVNYDRKECGKLAQILSQTIMVRMKEMTSVRHKYVCHVIVGEKHDQSIQMSSRCAWNPDADNYASANFLNSSLFAVGSVYGIYVE